ncbi:MAG: hypothetical protein HPY53_04860 [Brevinematales bacterium]|nr:hypothetical protein [Brevinematales bacterium]
MKPGKGWIRARLRRTAYHMMTLSFLTWCALLACYFINRQDIDIQFLTFTAAVIGIKRFLTLRQAQGDVIPGARPDSLGGVSRKGEDGDDENY